MSFFGGYVSNCIFFFFFFTGGSNEVMVRLCHVHFLNCLLMYLFIHLFIYSSLFLVKMARKRLAACLGILIYLVSKYIKL